ncbi:uncharacterized protein L969DRAFT_95182 [Mixia osmundae IAM 14324]|uniref:Uncharacterized protein n=1 Tax=Mixia osmundae (strain CBS 9802 / IAM 14324 / JCM 22182 / KY 12970) TaxID=764103 RepID=G7E6X6_MIXOS|nr:uncharacterized protein L969DRAFT_95182 [Mixia osmundae IAM 14324]KEI39031.1 hypothetical protein L969DRAFT_95182 [Mixia osmundae IAM 14324]GAA98586.1 hypothetical protein E5Q_05273 [Mixia osmundae IAM 14324]
MTFFITLPEDYGGEGLFPGSHFGCCLAIASGVLEIYDSGGRSDMRLVGPVSVYQTTVNIDACKVRLTLRAIHLSDLLVHLLLSKNIMQSLPGKQPRSLTMRFSTSFALAFGMLAKHAASLDHCDNAWLLNVSGDVRCPGGRMASTFPLGNTISFVLPTTFEDKQPVPRAYMRTEAEQDLLVVNEWFPIDLGTACGSGRRAGYKMVFFITLPDDVGGSSPGSYIGCCAAIASGILEIYNGGGRPTMRVVGPITVDQNCDLGKKGCTDYPENNGKCTGKLYSTTTLVNDGPKNGSNK